MFFCGSAGGKLVFTDWVVGIVVRTSGSCFRDFVSPYAPAIRKRRRVVVEVRLCIPWLHGVVVVRLLWVLQAAEKAWKPVDATLKQQIPWAPRGINPQEYEAATGILWKSEFTDVPDDGNCLLTAFLMGLQALVTACPQVAIPDDAVLPETSAKLREQVRLFHLCFLGLFNGDKDQVVFQLFQGLQKDATYRETIQNMLRLWLELDASVLLSQVT